MNSSVPQIRTEEEIRQWFVEKLTGTLNVDPQDIRLDEPLVAHGIDSMHFLELVGELEDWLGCKFKTNPLDDHPTINGLARFLGNGSQLGKTTLDSADR
jgi:8-amino-7-oxononanoate synthase